MIEFIKRRNPKSKWACYSVNERGSRTVVAISTVKIPTKGKHWTLLGFKREDEKYVLGRISKLFKRTIELKALLGGWVAVKEQ